MAKELVTKLKVAAGLQEEQQKSLFDQVDEACSLTWKQRIVGFGVCCGVGLLLSIVSIPLLWVGNVVLFAILYSVGAILSIGSTIFLMGPCNQLKRMMESSRIIATLVYLAAIAATLVIAFTTGNAALCLILLVVQNIALCWYCITWIPGGQSAVKALIVRG